MPRAHARSGSAHRHAVAGDGAGLDQGDVAQPRRRPHERLRGRVPLRAPAPAHAPRLPRGHARLCREARTELDRRLMTDVVPSQHFDHGDLTYEATIPKMLEALVGSYGDNDYVVTTTADGSLDRVTYAEADARSSELARTLLALGVVKGTRVGSSPNGPTFVVAFLAADADRRGRRAHQHVLPGARSRLGAPPRRHPLRDHRPFDPRAQRARSSRSERAWSCGLWTWPVLPPEHTDAAPRRVARRDRPTLGHRRRRDRSSRELLAAAESSVRPADDLVVIYTSGSTSDPKGVIHAQGTLLRHSRFIAAGHGWSTVTGSTSRWRSSGSGA